MNAVDTNVLIYMLDTNEPVKQQIARDLIYSLVLSNTPTVTPWQVVTEFLNHPQLMCRRNRLTSLRVDQEFQDMIRLFPLSFPDHSIFNHYYRLFNHYSLSHWDAMLLAACRAAGVTTLYSEDMDHSTDYDGLRIVNPFATP